jgi:hypothetical protein
VKPLQDRTSIEEIRIADGELLHPRLLFNLPTRSVVCPAMETKPENQFPISLVIHSVNFVIRPSNFVIRVCEPGE